MFNKVTCLVFIVSLFLGASLTQATIVQSWNRQADWTGQAGGNPAADGYGNSDVWLYEVWGMHDFTDHALSASPWWEDGPIMVGQWTDMTSYGFPVIGWGTSSGGGVVMKDKFMSGGGSAISGLISTSVRWTNPLTEQTDLTISGSYGIELGSLSGGGTGQTDFAILREPAGGGPLELLYHKRDSATIVDAMAFAGPNYTYSLPTPIQLTAQPGDSIIVTALPVWDGADVILSMYDNLTIGPMPVYESLTGQTLDGTFTPDGLGGGQLAISDTCSLYCTGNVNRTFLDASVELDLNLGADLSSGGLAKATWSDGSLLIKDSNDTILLTGELVEMSLEEVPGTPNISAGTGLMQLTGGNLLPYLPGDFAELVQVSFSMSQPIDGFSEEFSCVTNLTLIPVPEPATLALLVLGGGFIVTIRRRRGANVLLLIVAVGMLGVIGAADSVSASGMSWNRQVDWPSPGSDGTSENNPGPDSYGNPAVWGYESWAGIDPFTANIDSLNPWYTLPTDGLMQWANMPAPSSGKVLMGSIQSLLANDDIIYSGTHGGMGWQSSDAVAVTWTNPMETAEHVFISGSYKAGYFSSTVPTPGTPAFEGRMDMAILRKPAGGGAMEIVYSQKHTDVGLTSSATDAGASLYDLPFIDVLMQPGDQLLFTGMPIWGVETVVLLQDDITISVGSMYDFMTVEMLDTQFTPSGPDAGTLTMDGTCTLYCDGDVPATFLNTNVTCSLNLTDDYSSGGRAMGLFEGGTITFTEDDGTVLLTCTLIDLHLEELTASANTLLGSGTVQLTGGELADYILEDIGEQVTISFAANSQIDDFSASFDCATNLTIAPVPEPSMFVLLSLLLGGLVVCRRGSSR